MKTRNARVGDIPENPIFPKFVFRELIWFIQEKTTQNRDKINAK